MNPDIFIWAGYDADALPIMEQAKASDFAPPILLGAPPGWPADFGESPPFKQRYALRHVGSFD